MDRKERERMLLASFETDQGRRGCTGVWGAKVSGGVIGRRGSAVVREPRAGVVLRLSNGSKVGAGGGGGSKGFGSRIGRWWRWCGSLGQGLSFAFKRIKGRRGWRRRGEQRFRESDRSVVEVVQEPRAKGPSPSNGSKVGRGSGGGGGARGGCSFTFKRIEGRYAGRRRRWSKGFGSRIGRRWRWCGNLGQRSRFGGRWRRRSRGGGGLPFAFKRIEGRRGRRRRWSKGFREPDRSAVEVVREPRAKEPVRGRVAEEAEPQGGRVALRFQTDRR